MINEACFHDHCDEPNCMMGSLEYNCPCCKNFVIDYNGHYLEQYEYEYKEIECDNCKNKLILFYDKGWFVKEKITSEKFELFLENMGLESAYTGNPIKTRHFFEFSDGWLELAKGLIEELCRMGWNRKLTQSKEKFGALRFYTSGLTEECSGKINEYVKKSMETCELCGAPGEIINEGRWLSTRCGKHR